LAKIIARRIQTKGESGLNIWGKAILNALGKPLHGFIWFNVLAFGFRLLEQMFIQDRMVKEVSFTLYQGGVLFFFMWAVFRCINQFERLSRSLRIAQFLRVSAFVIGGFCFLQLLDIPLSGLLAFGGIGGIAIGFAAKDLFANFFGGFMLFLDQPFQIGDWIRSPNQEIEGRVEQIGWRLTRIRTPNKSVISIPNTVFSTIVVDNVSQISSRQIKTKITLIDMESSKLFPLLVEMQKHLETHPAIDKTLPFFANLMGFSPFGPEIVIQAYTKTVDLLAYQAIQQEIFLEILTILESRGAHLLTRTINQ
jgi:MscS family membrane protein